MDRKDLKLDKDIHVNVELDDGQLECNIYLLKYVDKHVQNQEGKIDDLVMKFSSVLKELRQMKSLLVRELLNGLVKSTPADISLPHIKQLAKDVLALVQVLGIIKLAFEVVEGDAESAGQAQCPLAVSLPRVDDNGEKVAHDQQPIKPFVQESVLSMNQVQKKDKQNLRHSKCQVCNILEDLQKLLRRDISMAIMTSFSKADWNILSYTWNDRLNPTFGHLVS
ncbi:hypothetical protein MLD38_006274 [Melastoma candidum]|uniref:Uncharacterized protein n=1 Tax=Melastoma candidum TaxID=119954 RepID=A0ACB9RMX4_9MYRT|nr:hypothetical protein MLD38_006274 [Melastoma candidum]